MDCCGCDSKSIGVLSGGAGEVWCNEMVCIGDENGENEFVKKVY